MSERGRTDGIYEDVRVRTEDIQPRIDGLQSGRPGSPRGERDALLDLKDARAALQALREQRREIVEAAVKAENERLWGLFGDLMDHWPNTPGGEPYQPWDWNGLIDHRWPEDWPARVIAEFDRRVVAE